MKLQSMLAGALLLAVCGSALAQGKLSLGGAMPLGDVKLQNVDGRLLSLSEAAGKQGTLVVFACNHCPFVKAWESRLAAIGNASLTNGIGVVFVNANNPVEIPADDLEHMQQQAAQAHFGFPYVVDASGDVARAFGAARTPEVFLFDAAGKLVYHGAVDDNAHEILRVQKHYLQDAIDALRAGKDIVTKETSSVGCGIKLRASAAAAK